MKHTSIASGVGAFVLACILPAYAADTQSHTTPPLPKALSSSDLAELSGGASPTGLAVSLQNLSAVNSDNQVNGDSIVTGDVTLQSGAFNGFNGIGNFVFNTGNNNNLQGTLSVTILTPSTN
jgi:hypothetical protein